MTLFEFSKHNYPRYNCWSAPFIFSNGGANIEVISIKDFNYTFSPELFQYSIFNYETYMCDGVVVRKESNFLELCILEI